MDLFEKAEEFRQDSRFYSAQKTYEKLLRLPSLTPEEKAAAILGLADMERIQGYFPQALRHYQKAIQWLENKDREAYWDAQAGWAPAARASAVRSRNLAVLQKALKAYRKQKDEQGEAFARWALGGTLRPPVSMKEGKQQLQTALRMFKRLKNGEGTAYTCCALGGIHRMLGHYGESGKFYREANRRMRGLEDTFGIAYSYCGLGNVERLAGRFQRALPFYQNAEQPYGAIGDRVSYAYTLCPSNTEGDAGPSVPLRGLSLKGGPFILASTAMPAGASIRSWDLPRSNG